MPSSTGWACSTRYRVIPPMCARNVPSRRLDTCACSATGEWIRGVCDGFGVGKGQKNIIPTLASRHLNCDVLCHNGNGVCGFPQKKILSRDKKGHYSEFSLVPLIMHSLIMLGQKDASFCQKNCAINNIKSDNVKFFNKRAGECSQKLANWWISNHWPLWSAIKRKPPKHWSLPKMRAVVQHKHHPAPGSPPPPCPSEWQRCPPPGSSATGTALWR